MIFNSLDFAIFLPVVFVLYWWLNNKSLRLQNLLIVLASYVFYGWWDWRFLSLIVFSTVVDYLVGLNLSTTHNVRRRKILLWTSVFVNLGFLGFFKYYNFFIDNFVTAFSLFGKDINVNSLNIILPVGISFYTFQTLSYTIDVYKKKLEPTKDIVAFAAFVSFFPQLVAGPIERATNLLPQFYTKRKFDYAKAVDGLRQILWGLFKKVVIADNCAKFANQVFNDYGEMNGSSLVLGALFFTFQIYGDFSGYSDIAIGTSRLFGFNLSQNFAFPYFSRDIAEFWRRWHISLTTWFRDYLYIPIGGSRGNKVTKVRNIFVIFTVSGFWHGANWTFIVWGVYFAILFMPYIFYKQKYKSDIVAEGKALPHLKEVFAMLKTFGLFAFSMIIFRSESIYDAFNYVKNIVSKSLFKFPNLPDTDSILLTTVLLIIFIIMEWFGREKLYALEHLELKCNKSTRYFLYYALVISIFWFSGKSQQFIYFQF